MRALTVWTRICVFAQADLILTRVRIDLRPYSVNAYLCVAAYQRWREEEEVPLALVVTRPHNNDFRFVNFLHIYIFVYIYMLDLFYWEGEEVHWQLIVGQGTQQCRSDCDWKCTRLQTKDGPLAQQQRRLNHAINQTQLVPPELPKYKIISMYYL